MDSGTGSFVIRGMLSRIRATFSETKVFVHLLVCTFAVASWANLNGMWVELPLLVPKAPEGWHLPSYITIISQIANVGPLAVVLVTILLPRTKGKLEKYTSGAIICLSVITSLLMAFFWDKTSYVAGDEHSTAMLALNFFLAIGDCTSSVTFYAFMSMMKPEYMASLFVGEGLSGMLPAMIALGQGAGQIHCDGKTPKFESPNFTVRVYFILLSCILIHSFVAFILLNTLPYCRSEMVELPPEDNVSIFPQDEQVQDYGSSANPSFANAVSSEVDNNTAMANHSSDFEKQAEHHNSNTLLIIMDRRWMNWKIVCFQIIVVVINMTLTSFLSTIQVYSTLPYGLDPYHLTTTLTQIANPVACIFALLFMTKSLLAVFILTLLGEGGVAYIIYVAAMSPNPPLHGETSGGNIIITVWVFLTLFLIYAKVCVAGAMRNYGRKPLILTGVCTQAGSFVGAVVGYLLVNTYDVFKQAPYC